MMVYKKFGYICYDNGRTEYLIDPVTHAISVYDYNAMAVHPAIDMTNECWWDLPDFDNALQAVKFIKTHTVI